MNTEESYLESNLQPPTSINGIEHFPAEVVEWMLDQQELQGNTRDIKVFERNKEADSPQGGFNWRGTFLGQNICRDIINGGNFKLFFEKFPRQTSKHTLTDADIDAPYIVGATNTNTVMNVPHLIKAGSTAVLLGQINPEPPKVDCRVWAEDSYREVLEILLEVRRIDVRNYIYDETPLLPKPLLKKIHLFLHLNEL